MKKKVKNFFERGGVLPLFLIASIILGSLALLNIVTIPSMNEPAANMRIYPTKKVLIPGDTFVVRIIVDSTIPVNVFGGELLFDHEILNVESIDYNTSVADLWAEKPWYSNGNGTLNFAGGTTRMGGFTGSETLMTVTFKTLKEGAGTLSLHDAKILRHDGLGTEASLPTPVDALFTIQTATSSEKEVVISEPNSTSYEVVTAAPSTDLNNDGRQSIADISIFILNIGSNNPRFDFNRDGHIDTKDLSIILNAR